MRTILLRTHVSVQVLWRFSLLAVAVMLLFSATIPTYMVAWLGRDDFSHGFFVPLISLYMVYRQRNLLLRQPTVPAFVPGLFLLLGGLLLLVAGRLTATISIQQISLLPVLAGLILLNFGAAHFRLLLLPLMYLVFMLPPVIDPLLARAYWPFQLFTAAISEELYRLAGIPVFREQQLLHLPETVLEVARECSGVRYLFSIIALAIPMAVFTLPTMIRRVAFVGCAIVIGLLTNPLRVLLIGVVVYYFHGEVHGPMHVLEGVSVSMVGYVFLFCCVWGFGKIPYTGSKAPDEACPAIEEVSEENCLSLRTMPWTLSLVTLLVVAGGIFFHAPRAIPPDQNFVLPNKIGEWVSAKQHTVEEQLIFHDADFSASSFYQNAQGEEVFVNYSYFSSQVPEKKVISYKNFFQTEPSVPVLFPASPGSLSGSAQRTLVTIDHRRYITYYWYIVDGEIVSSPRMEKYLSLRNILRSNRNNAKAISASIAFNHQEEVVAKQKQLDGFITMLRPLLDKGGR